MDTTLRDGDTLPDTTAPLAEGAVYLSTIDEARFGVRTARTSALSSRTLGGILQYCDERDVRLLIARAESADLETLRSARMAGLVLMDTLMCWSINLADVATRPIPSFIRLARPIDADQVRSVAVRVFRGYLGHYHADPRLDEARCDEVYGDWASRSCSARSNDAMLVAEVDGRIAGFGSARLLSPTRGEAVLGGVDPEHRGRHLYSALNTARMLWCKEQGATEMRSATLATNVLTQRAYVRAGLRHGHATHTFHKWFDPE